MFVYKHAGLADVTTTIRQLGDAGRPRREADALVTRIDAALAEHPGTRRRQTEAADACWSSAATRCALRGIYASGGIGFLHDMLTAAGGDNVFADVKQQSVQATTELILARAAGSHPRAASRRHDGRAAKRREIAVWQVLLVSAAVRSGRVYDHRRPADGRPGSARRRGHRAHRAALHPGGVRPMKILVSWSSGKDSAWMLHVLRAERIGRRRRC